MKNYPAFNELKTDMMLKERKNSQTCIHRKNSVKAEQFCDVFFILAKNVVIKCPGCESKRRGLVIQRLDYTWMTVALVYGTVRTQEVIIFVPVYIPDVYT